METRSEEAILRAGKIQDICQMGGFDISLEKVQDILAEQGPIAPKKIRRKADSKKTFVVSR
jgi:hypothetical protein